MKKTPWACAWDGDKEQGDFRATDDRGFQPLHYACARGHVEAALALARSGADPNFPFAGGDKLWTPMHFAAREGNFLLMNRLMNECGGEPEAPARDGTTPMDVLRDVLGLAKRAKKKKKQQQQDEIDDDRNRDLLDCERLRRQTSGERGEKPRELFTWGNGCNYQLGNGTLDSRDSPRKVRALQGTDIVSVAVAACHAVAAASDGRAMSWGFGMGGRLGHGNELPLLVPTVIAGIDRAVVSVSASDTQSAFVTDSGALYVCGNGALTPTRLRFPPGAAAVTMAACGAQHVVALTRDRTAFTAGNGSDGQLGHGTTESCKDPTPVTSLSVASGKVAMVAAGSHHTVFLTTDGKVFQCGGGGGKSHPRRVSITEKYEQPDEGFQRVSGKTREALSASFIAASGKCSVAIASSGHVHTWTTSVLDGALVDIGARSARSVSVAADGSRLAVVTTQGSLLAVMTQSRRAPKVVLRNVGCAFAAVGCFAASVSAPDPISYDGVVPRDLCDDVASLLETGAFCDVTLRANDGSRIEAHRALMSRCSSLGLDQDSLVGGVVNVDASSGDALAEFVRFVYTGKCTPETRDEVLRLGEELGLPKAPSHRDFALSLESHMRGLLESSEFSDVSVMCLPDEDSAAAPSESCVMHLHRAILGTRSAFFMTMLGSGMAEDTSGTVELREITKSAFASLVPWLYTDRIAADASARIETPLELLLVADRLLLPALGKACLNAVAPLIDLDNVFSVAELAEQYSQHELLRLCEDFLFANPASLACCSSENGGISECLSADAIAEMQAIVFQKAEATAQAVSSAYGPPLAQPSLLVSEEPLPPRAAESTGKKKKKAKPPKSQPQPLSPEPFPPQTQTATATPGSQPPSEGEMFWGSSPAVAATNAPPAIQKKPKKEKPPQPDAIGTAEELLGVSEELVSRKGSVPSPARPPSSKQKASAIISAISPASPKPAWEVPPHSQAGKHQPKQRPMQEILNEEQQRQQQASATRKPPAATRDGASTGQQLQLGEAISLALGGGKKPQPTQKKKATAWQTPPQATQGRRESLAAIQEEEKAKTPPPPPPSRRWESNPVKPPTTHPEAFAGLM